MADFSRLKLQKALQDEDEPDELDRLMAAQATVEVTPEPQPEPVQETPADGFDGILSELLEDDEPVAEKPLVGVKRPKLVVPPAAPKFGEKGFGKGVKKPHKGTPRLHLTEGLAELLAPLCKFKVMTTEAVSMVRLTEKSNISKGGEPMTVEGTRLKLQKLQRLGLAAVDWTYAGVPVWVPTPRALHAVRSFGYLDEDWDNPGEDEKHDLPAVSQYDHFRSIALVAAEFMSPSGYFRKSLGLEPVPFDALISEAQIRRAQQGVRDQLFEAVKGTENEPDFGLWRNGALKEAVGELQQGKLKWDELLEAHREFWTIGQPRGEKSTIQTHWPDLVVSLEEGRTAPKSESLLVEVELTIKSSETYAAMLRTFAEELKHQIVYNRVLYFTHTPKRLLKKLEVEDNKHGFGLLASGLVQVHPLTGRDGEPAVIQKRATRKPTWV